MKKIFNFFASLKFVFMPHYWVMNDGYNEEWDKKFCELAEAHDFEPDCDLDQEFGNQTYNAFLGEYRIWVSNYPFAFFSFCGKRGQFPSMTNTRPSRLTIAKYYKKLKADLAKHNCTHR